MTENVIDEPVESQPADVWGQDTAISVSELAASLPQQLAPVIDGAHELAGRITPAAIANHSYKIGEARNALKLATNTLSDAVNQFKLVAELLGGL